MEVGTVGVRAGLGCFVCAVGWTEALLPDLEKLGGGRGQNIGLNSALSMCVGCFGNSWWD